jgi:hypothetical protein
MALMHILFQPIIIASDEYKQGERTEQLGDSPKTEFQVRATFCGKFISTLIVDSTK